MVAATQGGCHQNVLDERGLLSIFWKIDKTSIFKAHLGPIICYKYVQHFNRINSIFC